MRTMSSQLGQLLEALHRGEITQQEFDIFKADLLRQALDDDGGTQPPPAAPGDEALGAYSLLGEIGRGGMGIVYRARHRLEARAAQQGGDIALKVMHACWAQDTEYRGRFEREAEVGLNLRHPGIVPVHDLVMDGHRLGLVMALVDGRPLSQVLQGASLSWQPAVARLLDTLDAIRYAHDQGVIHRDLKPGNILVTSDGRWQVTDFGLAKAVQREGMGNLTTTSQQLGTVAYMAPEQARNARDVDERADIYAMGLILLELLSGRPIWESASSPFQLHEWKTQDRLLQSASLGPDLPRELLQISARACRADPAQRYASALAMQTALRAQVAELGLEDVGAELKACFADPPGYMQALRARVVQHLQLASGNIKVMVEGQVRARVLELLEEADGVEEAIEMVREE